LYVWWRYADSGAMMECSIECTSKDELTAFAGKSCLNDRLERLLNILKGLSTLAVVVMAMLLFCVGELFLVVVAVAAFSFID